MGSVIRRRATERYEIDTEGSWAISYGDMITLLLTFFILFFSTDPKRDRTVAMESALMTKLETNSQTSPTPVATVGQDPQIDEAAQKKLSASIHKIGQKHIIEFPKVSFFKLGAVELNKEGRAELAKFVQLYMPYAGNYVLGIRAYTDNKTVKKSAGKFQKYSDNLELSALRSVATMRVFQKLGIPLNRMRLGGYGELRLTAQELGRAIASTPDYDRNGLALARKVVLVIEPEPKEEL